MRNTACGASLAPIDYRPEVPRIAAPVAVELDDEAGLIAFRAAERDLMRKGFADMDAAGEFAVAHPEVVR
jgi:hypothetical protein